MKPQKTHHHNRSGSRGEDEKPLQSFTGQQPLYNSGENNDEQASAFFKSPDQLNQMISQQSAKRPRYGCEENEASSMSQKHTDQLGRGKGPLVPRMIILTPQIDEAEEMPEGNSQYEEAQNKYYQSADVGLIMDNTITNLTGKAQQKSRPYSPQVKITTNSDHVFIPTSKQNQLVDQAPQNCTDLISQVFLVEGYNTAAFFGDKIKQKRNNNGMAQTKQQFAQSLLQSPSAITGKDFYRKQSAAQNQLASNKNAQNSQSNRVETVTPISTLSTATWQGKIFGDKLLLPLTGGPRSPQPELSYRGESAGLMSFISNEQLTAGHVIGSMPTTPPPMTETAQNTRKSIAVINNQHQFVSNPEELTLSETTGIEVQDVDYEPARSEATRISSQFLRVDLKTAKLQEMRSEQSEALRSLAVSKKSSNNHSNTKDSQHKKKPSYELISKNINSEPMAFPVTTPASEANSETTGDLQQNFNKRDEALASGRIQSDDLSRLDYVDTSNHLNGDIMLPRSQPINHLSKKDPELLRSLQISLNESRCRIGSPMNFAEQLRKGVVEAPLSSVDNSELFQMQGLNSTSFSSGKPIDVFRKKPTPPRPKLIANNLVQSIKIDGRTKMIVQESSLGQVQTKLDALVDRQQIRSVQQTRERIETRQQKRKEEMALLHSLLSEQWVQGSTQLQSPQAFVSQNHLLIDEPMCNENILQSTDFGQIAQNIEKYESNLLSRPIRNSRESTRVLRQSLQQQHELRTQYSSVNQRGKKNGSCRMKTTGVKQSKLPPKHQLVSVLDTATSGTELTSQNENVQSEIAESANRDINSVTRQTVTSLQDHEPREAANTSKQASEGMIVIHKSSDIITNPRHNGKQSKQGGNSRKRRGDEKQDRQTRLSTDAICPILSNPEYDPKVDYYSPKRMKQRVFTHERIKHKKEQRKALKDKRSQVMAPDAVEKLQRIRRAQASHKTQLVDRQNETLVSNQARKLKFKKNMTIDEMMKTRQRQLARNESNNKRMIGACMPETRGLLQYSRGGMNQSSQQNFDNIMNQTTQMPDRHQPLEDSSFDRFYCTQQTTSALVNNNRYPQQDTRKKSIQFYNPNSEHQIQMQSKKRIRTRSSYQRNSLVSSQQNATPQSLFAFSIPKAIQEHSTRFENAAREQALNDELPDFMREAYMFGLNETTKRERAPIILQQSFAERDQFRQSIVEKMLKSQQQPTTPQTELNVILGAPAISRPIIASRNSIINAQKLMMAQTQQYQQSNPGSPQRASGLSTKHNQESYHHNL